MRVVAASILALAAVLAAEAGLHASRAPGVIVFYGEDALPLSSGNRLGSIVVPAAGAASNATTATPFTIPQSTAYLACVIDAESSGYNFRTGPATVTAATTNDLNQVGAATLQIPLSNNTGVIQQISFFNAGAGGTVKVYALDAPVYSSVMP